MVDIKRRSQHGPFTPAQHLMSHTAARDAIQRETQRDGPQSDNDKNHITFLMVELKLIYLSDRSTTQEHQQTTIDAHRTSVQHIEVLRKFTGCLSNP